MKVHFLGAAREVTGSCFMIEYHEGRFAVDCGLHQGGSDADIRNRETKLYKPKEIDFILVTHAHLYHTGLLPRLVSEGYNGPVYCTPPTKDLMYLMLLDSAHIQEIETQWKNRKRQRHGEEKVEPLYTQGDVEKAITLIRDVEYDHPFNPNPGVEVTFRDSGHILGSALVEIQMTGNTNPTKLIFSGDIGRTAQLIVKDPYTPEKGDFLFMESTYGNRDHKNEQESLEELAEAIDYSYKNGEKVIIPAFAVERTQEIIYCLHLLHRDGRLPEDMMVYVDSPLAIKVTEIFHQYTQYFDEDAQNILKVKQDPLHLPQLRFTKTTEESIKINSVNKPSIVISASGMADAGRIKHHLRHNLWREGASVVFVGYQAQGTIGRRLVDGARKVRIFGEEIAVKAKIFTINGFSAHAGQSQLLEWLSHFRSPNLQVFLIHGEYQAQKALADLIRDRFNYPVYIPDRLEEWLLVKGETPKLMKEAALIPPVDWDKILRDLATYVEMLRMKRKQLESLSLDEQNDLREQIVRLESLIALYTGESKGESLR
ncbi:MAG: MBL fold metallo-hydrolase [Syntrophales bacterium]|nr:MBL fold metallo-hydrolase [Syntrophales bacterium]